MPAARLLPLFVTLSLAVSFFSACVDTTVLSSGAGCDAGPAYCGCKSDSDCATSVGMPRCDTTRYTCVPCLPQNDNCTGGNKCLADGTGSYRCAMNCISAGDCPQFDGGVTSCCASACVDLPSDPNNCGMCGKACATPVNGKAGCSDGACIIGSCNTGYADCNQNDFDGCEVNTTSDARNCGGCGAACPAFPNGTVACTAGKCINACLTGYADCNGLAADGCEVNTVSDSKNCGACNSLCVSLPNATPLCQSGACLISACVAGYLDCDHQSADGCEVNAGLDLNNCGACGNVCAPIPNAVVACEGGACGIGNCNMNFGDCNGLLADGCETSLSADPKNCGACGRVCNLPQAVSACSSGACTITGCTAGYADCNHMAADGCESHLASDALNCGACGNACPAGVNGVNGCVNATCAVLSCAAGFADCDKNPSNGCEVNLAGINNCGSCANVCVAPANASAGCNGMSCGIGACNSGYGDCDHLAANGCEDNTSTDLKNCGACGNACSTPNGTPSCVAGACATASCNTGFADCDGKPANGCETNTTSNANDCGQCGTVCAMGFSCTNGKCVGITVFSYAAAVNYACGAYPTSVALGDLNGDGKLDIATANFTDNNASVLLNSGNGVFGAAVNYVAGSGADGVAVGDLNGDGKLDLAVANYNDGNVSVLLNTGNAVFGAVTNHITGAQAWSVAAADLNGDGKLDLAVANFTANNVSVLLNTGNAVYGAAVNYAAGVNAQSIAIGDLNGDGKPDMVAANYGAADVSVFLNSGNGAFSPAVNYAAGAGAAWAAIGDLNGDGKPDLAVVNNTANNVSVLFGNGNGTFAAAINYATGTAPISVAIADLNGDTRLDLAVVNETTNNVSVFLNSGNGVFAAPVNFATGTSPQLLAIGDLNGDGKPDMAVVNGATNNVSVLLNTSH